MYSREFINDFGHYGDDTKMKDLMAAAYVSSECESTDTKDFITVCHISVQDKVLARTPYIVTRFK